MEHIVETLQKGGIILTPTDTTFGLSCLAFDPNAVDRIFRVKNRSREKNLLLLVANEAQLQQLVEVPDLAWDIIDLSEKPVTIVYTKILDVPNHLLAPDGTIGIRLIKMPLLQKIISKVKQPLVSTSANFSGLPTPIAFSQFSPEFLNKVDYVLPECVNFTPTYMGSSVIKIEPNGKVKVYRE